jgi:hypothetical protein
LGLLILSALLGLIAIFLYAKGARPTAEVAEIIGGVLAVVALMPRLVQRLRRENRRVAPKPADLESAKEILAGVVEEQWRVEATIRSLDDPDPIPVVWRLTERNELMDRPDQIVSGTLAFSGQSDRISGLADAFRQLRRRRLVILGKPGSGKTTLAVQLVLELLHTREEGDPIPVLFTVNSWDTAIYPRLQDWLVMELDRDYPAVRAEEDGANPVPSLAARAHILPVLDGLDEMPDAARAKVIAALNRSLSAEDQLISLVAPMNSLPLLRKQTF